MIALGYYLLKVFICSAVLFLYYHIALRNKIFHQWNRFYLLAVVVLSLVLPCLHINIGAADESNKAIHLLRVVSAADEYVVDASSRNGILSTTQWIAVLYTTLCAWLATLFLFSLARIYSIIRSGYSRHLHNIRLIDSEAKGTPFSFLHFIIWNKKIDLHSEAGQLVFKHELVHVQEKHTLDKLFLQTVLIFFWSNPVFWLIRKELCMIHEFIADQKAVKQQGTEAFAVMILQAAYPQQYPHLTHSFFQSPIKRRLAMLTKMQNPKISYFSRILVLPLLALVGLAFTLKTQTQPDEVVLNNSILDTNPKKENTVIKDVRLENIQPSASDTTQDVRKQKLQELYVVLDGAEYKGDIKDIEPNSIESINILKDESAIKKYGEKGKNGVIEITTKKSANNIQTDAASDKVIDTRKIKPEGNDLDLHVKVINLSKAKDYKNIPIIIDDNFFKGSIEQLPFPESEIHGIYFAYGQPLVKDFGNKAKQGAIIITTKKYFEESEKNRKPETRPVFTQAEIDAHFPGDQDSWRNYLQKNLDASISIKNGAPEGTYTVQVQFVVHADGSLTDIKTLTHYGYGMEEEVVKLIKNGPKWVPAEQNGRAVASIKKQPVTFVVAAQ